MVLSQGYSVASHLVGEIWPETFKTRPSGSSLITRAPLSIGIGINTGPVIVGYIGASRRLDYTAIGDTVNVAARLTERAQPDQILISSSTHAEISAHLPARRLEAMQLKGKADPIDVYEILWRETRTHTIAQS